MKKPKKIIATINFKKVDAINPKKDPKAAFKAFSMSFLCIISPISAPIKGPITIPNGMGE